MPNVPRRARILIVAACFLIVPTPAWSGAAEESEKAARALLCDCGCSPQSVHDCACGRAAAMRDELMGKARSGMTGQQILDEAVARNGEKVLLSPIAAGFNLLAWLGPSAALLLGLVAMILILRRWRPDPRVQSVPAPALPAADDPYGARLERELRERE